MKKYELGHDKHTFKELTDSLLGKSKDEGTIEFECFPLEEGSTEDAAGTLKAILGMFKGHEDNDIYKMGKGIQDDFKKKGSFSPGQAKWIWKTSLALFKK